MEEGWKAGSVEVVEKFEERDAVAMVVVRVGYVVAGGETNRMWRELGEDAGNLGRHSLLGGLALLPRRDSARLDSTMASSYAIFSLLQMKA